ncbi:hypothetical protein ACOSQ3_020171 [Xanthoceras sorbifolium]
MACPSWSFLIGPRKKFRPSEESGLIIEAQHLNGRDTWVKRALRLKSMRIGHFHDLHLGVVNLGSFVFSPTLLLSSSVDQGGLELQEDLGLVVVLVVFLS